METVSQDDDKDDPRYVNTEMSVAHANGSDNDVIIVDNVVYPEGLDAALERSIANDYYTTCRR